MKRTYEVRDRADKRAIREFLKREGQFLLPMLELVEQTEVVIDEVIQVMGRATIEAVLEMSAEGVAGVKQAGRSRAEDDTVWYGRQGGVVYLSDRKVRVERPRLRRRGAGEGGDRGAGVRSDAETGRRGGSDARGWRGFRVIGEMADTVSKSALRRSRPRAEQNLERMGHMRSLTTVCDENAEVRRGSGRWTRAVDRWLESSGRRSRRCSANDAATTSSATCHLPDQHG